MAKINKLLPPVRMPLITVTVSSTSYLDRSKLLEILKLSVNRSKKLTMFQKDCIEFMSVPQKVK